MSIKISEAEADLEHLTQSLATGQPLDASVKKRIRDRSEALRQERFQRSGMSDAAVELIREVRDE